ncbi:hypothetical protein ACTXT7_016481 [Hymenolepis weldensis]
MPSHIFNAELEKLRCHNYEPNPPLSLNFNYASRNEVIRRRFIVILNWLFEFEGMKQQTLVIRK